MEAMVTLEKISVFLCALCGGMRGVVFYHRDHREPQRATESHREPQRATENNKKGNIIKGHHLMADFISDFLPTASGSHVPHGNLCRMRRIRLPRYGKVYVLIFYERIVILLM
jgi:hypothetical protein